MLKKLPLIKSLLKRIWTKIDFIKRHKLIFLYLVKDRLWLCTYSKEKVTYKRKNLPFCPEEEAQKLKTFFKVMDAGFKQCPGFL